MLELYGGVLIFNCSLVVFFGFFLLFNNKQYGIIANKFLGMVFILIGLSIIFLIFDELRLFPVFDYFDYMVAYVSAPFMYFYSRAYLRNGYQFNIKHLLHLVPFVVELFIWYHFYFKLSPAKKDIYTLSYSTLHDLFSIHWKIVLFIIAISYSTLIIKEIRSFHKKAKEEYSYTNNETLRWLYFLLGTIMFMSIFASILPLFGRFNTPGILTGIITVCVFIEILIILLRPEVYREPK